MPLSVVFMGTPQFAVPSLRALAAAHTVSLVVTRPDAVRSRGKATEPSAVKACALELGLDVLETSRMDSESLERVAAANPDVICVAAYGCILPDEVLQMAPLGCVNVHGSLLPRWRGAAPIQRAILAGDERAGISIMRVVHELDAGAYCRQASLPTAGATSTSLMADLAQIGAEQLVAALDDMAAGTAEWTEQDESLVTYAAKVSKAEMRLDPVDCARDNLLRVAASMDAAPARAQVAGRGVRVMQAAVSDESVPSGKVLVSSGHVLLGCADATFEPLIVKPDGKREMPVSAWAAGLRGDDLDWGRV